MSSSPSLPSSVRIYATAYRSVTLPCNTDFCWAAMSPPASIASWGCSIVDRCDIDDQNPAVRCVHLVPADPATPVMLKEKLVKAERTPAGEKGTLVYEHVDSGPLSPFPAPLVEMSTSLSVSKITTLTSPLGRTFVELRSTFVVMSPEDADATRSFLEQSYFEPLLHCATEMLVPVQPFRDSMFHNVMRHFEDSVEKLMVNAARVKTIKDGDAIFSASPLQQQNNCNNSNTNNTSSSPHQKQQSSSQQQHTQLLDPIAVSTFANSAVSVCQELYSAWLETSRELRRVEKKLEEDNAERENALAASAVAAGSKNAPQHHPSSSSSSESHHMSSRYFPDRQPKSSQRPKMQDIIGLNPNNVFGRHFEMSTPGTYIVSSPVSEKIAASLMDDESTNLHDNSSSNNNNNQNGGVSSVSRGMGVVKSPASATYSSPARRGGGGRSVVLTPPGGWEQEVFDDGADPIVAEDASRVMDGRGQLMQDAPAPPPRRVLGGK